VAPVADSEEVLELQTRLGEETWKCEYTNNFGEVRLSRVRGMLNLNLGLDRWKCGDLYSNWVLDDNNIVIKGTDLKTMRRWYIAVKARKRGNDLDAFRITRRLAAIRDGILPYVHTGSKIRHTNAIYVTGTVDPRLVDYDLEYGWMYLGVWFNTFMAHLRKKLTCITAVIEDKDGQPKVREVRTVPKILILRSWESHESGWPHFHAILCLEWGVRGQPHWDVFQDKGCWKDGHWVPPRWRVKDKHVLDECWPYGWVDAIALTAGTLEKNLENVVWYVGKNLSCMDYRLVSRWPRKRTLTQSILWYFRKRSFSVSDFEPRIYDRHLVYPTGDRACWYYNKKGVKTPKREYWHFLLGSPADDLTKRTCIIQTDLDGDDRELLDGPAFVFELVGLVRRKDTELGREDWVKTYSDPPSWLDRCWKPKKREKYEYWASRALHHNPNAGVPWATGACMPERGLVEVPREDLGVPCADSQDRADRWRSSSPFSGGIE